MQRRATQDGTPLDPILNNFETDEYNVIRKLRLDGHKKSAFLEYRITTANYDLACQLLESRSSNFYIDKVHAPEHEAIGHRLLYMSGQNQVSKTYMIRDIKDLWQDSITKPYRFAASIGITDRLDGEFETNHNSLRTMVFADTWDDILYIKLCSPNGITVLHEDKHYIISHFGERHEHSY